VEKISDAVLPTATAYLVCIRTVVASSLKTELAQDLLKTADTVNLQKHIKETSAFRMFIRTLPSDNLTRALSKIGALIDKPVVTLQGLTATEAIDRRMIMETKRRMERARKKANQNTDKDGEAKTARPYVREGGIFGRKKETDEGDDKCKRRERGACSGNLWVYINGYDFDKPMSSSSTRPHPIVTEEDDDVDGEDITEN